MAVPAINRYRVFGQALRFLGKRRLLGKADWAIGRAYRESAGAITGSGGLGPRPGASRCRGLGVRAAFKLS